jgi:hypothetical protein
MRTPSQVNVFKQNSNRTFFEYKFETLPLGPICSVYVVPNTMIVNVGFGDVNGSGHGLI